MMQLKNFFLSVLNVNPSQLFIWKIEQSDLHLMKSDEHPAILLEPAFLQQLESIVRTAAGMEKNIFFLRHHQIDYHISIHPQFGEYRALVVESLPEDTEKQAFIALLGQDFLQNLMDSLFEMTQMPAQLRFVDGQAITKVDNLDKFCLKEDCPCYIENNCPFACDKILPYAQAHDLNNQPYPINESFAVYDLHVDHKLLAYLLIGKYLLPEDARLHSRLSGLSNAVQVIMDMIHNLLEEKQKQRHRYLELLQLQNKVAKSEEKYRRIFNNTPLGIFYYNVFGEIQQMNDVFVRQIGSTREKLEGFNMLEKLKDQELLKDLKKALKGERSIYRGVYSSLTSQKQTPVIVRFNPVYSIDGSMDGGVCIVEDISELYTTEGKIHKLNDVFVSLGSDPKENVNKIVQASCELLDGACSLYNRLDKEENSLITWSDFKAPPDMEKEDKPDGHICYEATIKGLDKPVVINELKDTEYEKSDRNVQRYKLRSYLGCPVQLRNKPIGSLCIVDVEPRKFSKLEVHIMSTLARAISLEEERLAVYKELAASKENLQQLIENMEDAVFIRDSIGEILYINPAAEKIFGYSIQTMIENKELSRDVIFEDDKERVTSVFSSEEFQQFSRFSLQHRIKTANGKIKWVWTRIFPVRNEEGEIIMRISIVADITEQKHSEAALIKAKEKAQESDRLKSTFLANMSHELRTPMNSILGFADLLKEDEKDKERSKIHDIILANGNRLKRLLDDILDVSLLESGTISVKKEWFPMNSLVLDLYRDFKYHDQLDREQVQLIHHAAFKDMDDLLYSDASCIAQIMGNLLDNAIRHTKRGYIEFGYERCDEKICFYVSDTGEGIAEERKKNLFMRFYSDHEAAVQSHAGLGLGLYIVKEVSALINGSVTFTTEKGKGTRFNILLPYSKNNSEKKVDDMIKENKTLPKVILIVEDVESNFLLLKRYLKGNNFDIIRAEDGLEAVEKFKQNKIDLVLMDIRLPLLNGVEAMKRIKVINPEVPVIAQTAHAMAYDKQKLISQGFDFYISKPLRKQEVIDVVMEQL